jgi:DNA-binding response OmpR family regulator
MMTEATHRVLVIDDDGNLRQLLKLLFEHHGYEILLAPDGEIGMTLAEGGRPDVILLDVAMPYRSGIEVYLDLQNNALTSNIPVLVCSAALTKRETETWQGMPNVVEVVQKPFDINKLIARIAAICEERAAEIGV